MNPATKTILKEAVVRSASDPAFFLRFFLSHWFPSDIPPVHLGIIALATRKVGFLNNYPEAIPFLLEHFRYEADSRDPTAKPTPVFILGDDGRIKLNMPGEHLNEILPRGFSKTTILKALSLYDALTDGTMFVVFISASATHAETQLNDIKVELEANEKLRAAYGIQVPTRADPEKWSAKELHLLNGAIVISKGRGGQVRGLTFNGRRPNKIVLDDIEDEESVATEEQRKKTLNWFYSSVIPAGQIMEGAVGQDWAQEPLQIVNLGTLLAPECLVTSLTADVDFRTIRFGAKINETTMLWPYKMSEVKYAAMRSKWQRAGQLAQFVREYDSSIRVSDETLFPSIFIYQPTQRSDLVAVAQALDPAISKKKEACHSAIVVTGRKDDGQLWILDEWGGIGKTPKECVDQLFEFHKKWNTTHNGIETVQYQAALVDICREEMARRQLFFHITSILQGSADRKSARISGILSPRYMNGYLRHLRPFPNLEGNLADWPGGKVDYADAAAMSLSLLGETSGLLMEGALEHEAPLPPMATPETVMQRGNWLLQQRTPRALRAGRYG